MTADEILRRIGYLEGRIDALQKENAALQKNIDSLEEGNIDVSSLAGKWEEVLSNCFGVVQSNLSKVDPSSGFSSYYLEKINAILSGKEATEIGACLDSMKAESKKKILDFEDEIKTNHARIFQYQNELGELRALQITEAVNNGT